MEFILVILTIITIFIVIILKRWDELDWDDFEFEFDFSLILEIIAIGLSHIEMFFKRIIKTVKILFNFHIIPLRF